MIPSRGHKLRCRSNSWSSWWSVCEDAVEVRMLLPRGRLMRLEVLRVVILSSSHWIMDGGMWWEGRRGGGDVFMITLMKLRYPNIHNGATTCDNQTHMTTARCSLHTGKQRIIHLLQANLDYFLVHIKLSVDLWSVLVVTIGRKYDEDAINNEDANIKWQLALHGHPRPWHHECMILLSPVYVPSLLFSAAGMLPDPD